MSLISPLKCLFCRHLNPAGASFCNDCGSQLNLQPCGQCGAIDDRAAKNCYKCGADFSLAAAPGLQAPFAPAIPETELTYPAINNANVTPEQAAHSVDEAVSIAAGASPAGAPRGIRMALPGLLLALFAASVYLYSRPSAQLPPRQGLPPATAAVLVAPAPIEPKLAQTGRRPQIAAGTVDLDKAPSMAAPVAGAKSASDLAPVAEAEAKSRQDAPVFQDCPPAVATLGLCSPIPKQEGQ